MWTITLLAAFLTGFATWAMTRMVLEMLRERDIMDRPNDRSSHGAPVPRGGGLAIVTIALPSWLILCWFTGTLAHMWPVLVGALVLAGISWWDDIKDLPALPRFGAQILAAAFVLSLLPANVLLFDGLVPTWLERAFLAVAWIWFINLYNFMDGIDGMTGAETIAIAGGLAIVILDQVSRFGGDWSQAALAAVLAGGAAGFLVLNWHPARIFLGDVGSVTLGFLLGFLLIWQAAAMGHWMVALLLPLYYWGDATTTLIMRMARGGKFWRPHRDHAYQAAIKGGRDHAWVVKRVSLMNILLVACAYASLVGGWLAWLALVVGVVTVAGFLWYLRSQNRAETA